MVSNAVLRNMSKANWEADYEQKQEYARAMNQLVDHGIADKGTWWPAVGGRKVDYDEDDNQSMLMHACVDRYKYRDDSADENFAEDEDIDPLVWQRTTSLWGNVTAMRINRYSKLPQAIKKSLTAEDLVATIRMSRAQQSRIFEAGKAPEPAPPSSESEESGEDDSSSEDSSEEGDVYDHITSKKRKRGHDTDSNPSERRRRETHDSSSQPSSNGKGKRKATEAVDAEEPPKKRAKSTTARTNSIDNTSYYNEPIAIASPNGRRSSKRIAKAQESASLRNQQSQSGPWIGAKNPSAARVSKPRRAKPAKPVLIARLRIKLWDEAGAPRVRGMMPQQEQVSMETMAPKTLKALQRWRKKFGAYEEERLIRESDEEGGEDDDGLEVEVSGTWSFAALNEQ